MPSRAVAVGTQAVAQGKSADSDANLCSSGEHKPDSAATHLPAAALQIVVEENDDVKTGYKITMHFRWAASRQPLIVSAGKAQGSGSSH